MVSGQPRALYRQGRGPIAMEQGTGCAQNHHTKHKKYTMQQNSNLLNFKTSGAHICHSLWSLTLTVYIPHSYSDQPYFCKHNGITITNALLGNQG
jgi:hypothetical protein